MLRGTPGGGARITLGPQAIAKCLGEYAEELRARGCGLELAGLLLVGYQAKLLEWFDVDLALPPLQWTRGDSAKPEREDRGGLGG